MRYEDWDILLFPSGRDDRVPMKEFKVNCHVVTDTEFCNNRNTFGLPVMTCFIPSLQPGAPFQISIHSWGTPKLSQYARDYSKHPELVKLATRILIDGRLVASTWFEPFGQWPQSITSTCEMTKQGELEQLKFPSFRRELLYQNHWNPHDDVGRIKIVISEGFPRDSPSTPIEQVKNVVAFSFQHAPLDILEANGIAWPNPQMWRPQNNPALPVPTYHPDDGAESHLHSPRRRSLLNRVAGSSRVPMPTVSSALTSQSFANSDHFPPTFPTFQKSSTSSASSFLDPFSEAAHQEWINSLGLNQQQPSLDPKTIWPSALTRSSGKQSGIDTSMPSMSDHLSSTVGQITPSGSMHLSGPSLDEDTSMDSLKVPTNTPTTFLGENMVNLGQFSYSMPYPAISSELAESLTHSLLNQPHPLSVTSQSLQAHQIPLPASEVRSRKENRHLANASSVHSPSSNPSPSTEAQVRKFSQTSNAFGIIGNVRTDSSGSSPTFSLHTSAREFGAKITNMGTPNQMYAGVAASGTAPGSGSEKGIKRGRNFTPATARDMDKEDEPRRLSPHMRVSTAFLGDVERQNEAQE